MDYIFLFFVAGVSYAMGYISHNKTITYDYEELRRSYDQLYALDNETISQLNETIVQLQQTIIRLKSEITNRGTDK